MEDGYLSGLKVAIFLIFHSIFMDFYTNTSQNGYVLKLCSYRIFIENLVFRTDPGINSWTNNGTSHRQLWKKERSLNFFIFGMNIERVQLMKMDIIQIACSISSPVLQHNLHGDFSGSKPSWIDSPSYASRTRNVLAGCNDI